MARNNGQTLGIIGEGALGQSVAALGRAFGMRVLFAAHKNSTGMGPLYTQFDEVLATSDVMTLHCPLMPSTRNLLSTREFALIGQKADRHQHGQGRPLRRAGSCRGSG